MSKSISQLIKMVGSEISEAEFWGDWGNIEENIGLPLPGDYKKLVTAFGRVRVHSIRILPPLSEGKFPGIVEKTEEAAEVISGLYDVEFGFSDIPLTREGLPLGGKKDPFSFYPRRPGLLAWGTDHVGGFYYWNTEGDPDDWSVVMRTRDDWWDAHDVSMSEYLLGIVTGGILCDVPPSRFEGWKLFGKD